MTSSPTALRILVVCTGNICRSPMGEAVLRARLHGHGLGDRVVVASAGTYDGTAGEPADPRAIAVARDRGYDLRRHVARSLARADFQQFALMLGMTGEHVQELERLRPKGMRVDVRRYLDLTPGLDDREVPDPYLGSMADFERALDLVEQGAEGIVSDVVRRIGR